jgi:uncharacterized protein
MRDAVEPEDVETWKRSLLRFREQKDDFFRLSPESPMGHESNEVFKGLNYFDPDPAFRFETILKRNSALESVIMSTSKGTRQLFNRVGVFDLSIEGKSAQLWAYQSAEREDRHIFIPFRDETSGVESYPAGRYMDLEVEHDDNYAVDFNYAYNPYCAYNEGYVCPLPPSENWLKVTIRAGEKKYHE